MPSPLARRDKTSFYQWFPNVISKRGWHVDIYYEEGSSRWRHPSKGFLGLLLFLCAPSFSLTSSFHIPPFPNAASAKNFLGDVEGLMLDSADAMCTANAGSSACTAKSAGTFVTTAETGTTGVLGGLVEFLEAIDDEVTPSINATIDDLTLARVDLDSIEAYTDLINGNITLIQQYKDWLIASAPADEATPLTTALPKGELPVVTAEQLAAVEDGRTAVATARSNAEEIYGTITQFMATDVAQAVAEFNTSTPAGTTTTQLLEPLDQIFDSILQGRDMALKYHAIADEQGETYSGYLTQKTWAVTLIFLLPFLLQIIMTLLNRRYSKSSAHLVMNMCCGYFCLLFFIILAIVFSLLAVVSSTVCEYHLELVAKVIQRS